MTKAEIMKEEERGILQICQDIHMTTMGSYERSDYEQARDINILRLRLKHWDVSFPKAEPWDNLVKQLVKETIVENFIYLHR